jgi:hypothetical protein
MGASETRLLAERQARRAAWGGVLAGLVLVAALGGLIDRDHPPSLIDFVIGALAFGGLNYVRRYRRIMRDGQN